VRNSCSSSSCAMARSPRSRHLRRLWRASARYSDGMAFMVRTWASAREGRTRAECVVPGGGRNGCPPRRLEDPASQQRRPRTHLAGLHRLLAEQPLECAGGGRRVARKVVIEESEHFRYALPDCAEGTSPLRELGIAIDLQAREVGDRSIGAHPADVVERGG